MLFVFKMYGEEDLTVESKVDGEGNINVPLLGEVLVEGKTVSELQEYLTKRLAGGYVGTPRVTAFVSRYRNIYVSGEVKAPGGHPYEQGLSVQKAITLAGGLTDKADRENVQVLRRTKDQDEIIPVMGTVRYCRTIPSWLLRDKNSISAARSKHRVAFPMRKV